MSDKDAHAKDIKTKKEWLREDGKTGRTWNERTSDEIKEAFESGKDNDLQSENSFRMMLRAYTADNMYQNLNNALATGLFSDTENYFCALAKGLEVYGEKYKA